jgi:hypothetical protein
LLTCRGHSWRGLLLLLLLLLLLANQRLALLPDQLGLLLLHLLRLLVPLQQQLCCLLRPFNGLLCEKPLGSELLLTQCRLHTYVGCLGPLLLLLLHGLHHCCSSWLRRHCPSPWQLLLLVLKVTH